MDEESENCSGGSDGDESRLRIDKGELGWCDATPFDDLSMERIMTILRDYQNGKSLQSILDMIPKETGWVHNLLPTFEKCKNAPAIVFLGHCALFEDGVNFNDTDDTPGPLTLKIIRALSNMIPVNTILINMRKTCRRTKPSGKDLERGITRFCYPIQKLESNRLVAATKLELLIAEKEFNIQFHSFFTFSAAWEDAWEKLNYGSINFQEIPRVHNYFHIGHVRGSVHTSKSQRTYETKEKLFTIIDNLRAITGEDNDRDCMYDEIQRSLDEMGEYFPMRTLDPFAPQEISEYDKSVLDWQEEFLAGTSGNTPARFTEKLSRQAVENMLGHHSECKKETNKEPELKSKPEKPKVKKQTKKPAIEDQNQKTIQAYEEMANGKTVTYFMEDKQWRIMKRIGSYKGVGFDEWKELPHQCGICGFRTGEEKSFWAHVKREHVKSNTVVAGNEKKRSSDEQDTDSAPQLKKR